MSEATITAAQTRRLWAFTISAFVVAEAALICISLEFMTTYLPIRIPIIGLFAAGLGAPLFLARNSCKQTRTLLRGPDLQQERVRIVQMFIRNAGIAYSAALICAVPAINSIGSVCVQWKAR